MPTPRAVTTWHYDLPTDPTTGDGWAEIVLCSTGFFSAVSDWGDYAYAWRSTGKDDFREFMLRAKVNPDYFLSKLHPSSQHEYDEEATLKNVLERIEECRQDSLLTEEELEDEVERLEQYSNLEAREEFSRWVYETKLYEPWSCVVFTPTFHAVTFCKTVLSRLADMIEAELAFEVRCVGVPHVSCETTS